MKKYNYVGLGGTFDHFHAGHASFLQQIADQAEHLIIGITTDKLLTEKILLPQLQSYNERMQAVSDYCRVHHISCELVPLDDIYGPTLTDYRIEAVFVTPETEKGGLLINAKRQELGKEELPIIKVELLMDEVDQVLSSTRIRKGVVSRSGNVYEQLFSQTITLSSMQRDFFSQKQGKVISQLTAKQVDQQVLLVGDSTFEAFSGNNWQYTTAVIDFKKQRVAYQPDHTLQKSIQIRTSNPAGKITPELFLALQQALTTQSKLVYVEGEEDLAAVAAVFILPFGSKIYYGQPGEGIVEVLVTEELKTQFYQVLMQQ